MGNALLVVLVAMSASIAGCRSPIGLADDPRADRVEVVTLNLWHDKQDWPRRQGMIVAELKALAPDVIFLQEVLQDTGLPNQAATLARALGYRYRFYSVDPPERARRYGNAILTRTPILQSRQALLEPLDDYRNAGWVRTSIAGQAIDLYVTHLHHLPEGSAVRSRQAQGLLALIEATRGAHPVLIGGDFNARADAIEFLDLRERFADAYAAAHPRVDTNAPMHSTLNPHAGHAPLRIDHVFFEADRFAVGDARIILDAADASGAWPSDHHGLWVVLQPRRTP